MKINKPFIIRELLDNKYLCLSDLQTMYDKLSVIHGWPEKRIHDLFSYKENSKKVSFLINKPIKEEISTITQLKDLGLYKTSGRDQNKSTWCERNIWLMVYSELNPVLYADFLNILISGDSSYIFFKKTQDFDNTWISELPDIENMSTYLVFDSGNGFYKIGRTKSLKKRMIGLFSMNLNIKLITWSDMDIESILHGKYSHLNITNEWFDLHDCLEDVIQDFKSESKESLINGLFPYLQTIN